MPRVRVRLHPGFHPERSSSTVTGLRLLADAGHIELGLTSERDRSSVTHRNVAVIDVEHEPGQRRRLAVDLSDGPEPGDAGLVAEVDTYLKRTVADGYAYPPEVEALGLVFPCRPPGRRWLRLDLAYVRAHGPRGAPLARGRQLLAQLGTRRPRLLSEIERSPDLPQKPLVLFQPRLWTVDETSSPGLDAVNQRRIDLVRGLRTALGDHFVGGIVPSAEAERRCPELITRTPTGPMHYIDMLHRSTIAVSSIGLRGSAPWKIGEALAASKIVLSEPLAQSFPGDWSSALQYFADVDDCIARCESLLDDPDRCAELARASHDYYLAHVRPDSQLAPWVGAAARAGNG